MASSGNKNPGNFANDRDKASEAGKKGGHASGGNDRGKTSEADKKGSERSQGGRKS